MPFGFEKSDQDEVFDVIPSVVVKERYGSMPGSRSNNGTRSQYSLHAKVSGHKFMNENDLISSRDDPSFDYLADNSS